MLERSRDSSDSDRVLLMTLVSEVHDGAAVSCACSSPLLLQNQNFTRWMQIETRFQPTALSRIYNSALKRVLYLIQLMAETLWL